MQIVTPPGAKERVGFIVPRWTARHLPERQGVPFRSISVASALHDAGYEVAWCDEEHDFYSGDPAATESSWRCALADCRVVLFWVNELDPATQCENTFALATRVRAWNPRVKIAVGGSLVDMIPRGGLPAGELVDFYLRGYGEESAAELVNALRENTPLDAISGLVWNDGSVRENTVRSRQRLRADYLRFYRDLDLSKYVLEGGIFGNDQPTLHLGTARGCAKGCSFCYWTTFEPANFAAEDIADLVVDLRKRYGVRQYHLAELDFFAAKARPLKFARLLRERAPDCRWFALGSLIDVRRLTENEWDDLAAGGLLKLELGSESGSPAVLEQIKKKHEPEDSITITRQATARGIATMHNFVFGFPGETKFDRDRSFDLIHRLSEIDADRVGFTFRFFQPTWTAPLGAEAAANLPGYPRSLEEVLAYRPRFGKEGERMMLWMDERDEREIKRLVYYFLPMTTSRLEVAHPVRRWLYRGLRRVAKQRLRRRSFEFPIDAWLYERAVAGRLDNTFRP